MTDLTLANYDVKALLEIEVITQLLNNPKYFNSSIHHIEKEYFSTPELSLMFDTIKKYYISYSKSPDLKELILSHKESSVQVKDLIKKGVKEVQQNIKSNKPVNEELLTKQTELFIKDAIFTKALILGADAMGEHNQDKKMKSFMLAEQSVKVSLDSDFGTFMEEIDKRFKDYEEKQGLKLNIKSFDDMIGPGYLPKTLHLIAAASGIGKSAMLCTFAAQFLKQKQDVVIISLEMAESEFYKRIDANLLDVPIYDLSKVDKQVLKNNYNEIKDTLGKLVVKEYPAGGLTPLGLQNYLEKLKNEKGINNPVVMVDYLSLIASDRLKSSDNSYGYYKSVAEELRAVAQKMNLIMFTPMQLNRSAVNNVEADQSSISDSMGVYMTSDSVFIISQTPDMKIENEMRISYVKNRMSGKTNYFKIGYDYSHFRVNDIYQQENSSESPQSIQSSVIENKLNNIMNY